MKRTWVLVIGAILGAVVAFGQGGPDRPDTQYQRKVQDEQNAKVAAERLAREQAAKADVTRVASQQGLLVAIDGPKGNGKVSTADRGTDPDEKRCDVNGETAYCTSFSVPLPVGAQIDHIEGWGTKTLPSPNPDWLSNPSKSFNYGTTGEYDYSEFINVQQDGNLVTGTFRNRATGIDRYAELRVYYKLPK